MATQSALTFGSLFCGIGGLDLGLERAGMQCSWQVELDPFCQRVLAKHWPNVRRHDDVRTFPPSDSDDWWVDLICGGFPCQDVSGAGPKVGLTGARSGLWFQYTRIIRELQPRFVLVENVADLLARGMDRVLGDLAELGFNAEWSVLPACAMGAPHTRERVFIVAYANSLNGQKGLRLFQDRPRSDECGDGGEMPGSWLEAYTDATGVADGIPDWMDRNRSIGNAVVPQVAEWIGRRIMEAAS